ncbi:STAS domain-containing protein [Peribacillus glennii]|uniref:STAS domain-containing protein n=1 Tax=Peribacillus glennii TaxID=2303991 RepID=A0A372L7V4_9BACI|nr:STAS domain-containing protein [Peribacillus glennii]RFU61045.1 STAS domain-containing protein [Peribacillus glennii]
MDNREETVNTQNITIGGLDFSWNLEKGTFQYENTDAVLFWITSAMKSFFDTIEEISGEKAANLVLETTGYRQGLVVGEYFQNLSLPIPEALSLIPNTYASAGWGKFTVTSLDPDKKTAAMQIEDSWESKINKAQGRTQHGRFIPGHFAGLLSGLFGQNIWYKQGKASLENDNTIFTYEFFPSETTVQQNIHDLARSEEAQQIRKLEQIVQERTSELNDLVKEISSPIIPVLEGIVVVPLLGKYDENRSDELIEKTLNNLPSYKAKYLVLDLTGLDKHISEYTVSFINKLASAASLIGTETILVGISAELAMTIAQTNNDLSKYNFFNTLQHGIYYALAQEGRKIV